MTIEATNHLGLDDLPTWSHQRTYRRRLVLDGKPLSASVWGEAIGAQFKCDAGFLLITHYDYYDAANHWLYVVGNDGSIMDAASVPDYFGFVQDARIEGHSAVSLGFYGTNDRWVVTVSACGFWSFRGKDFARRTNRFLLSKRYMELQRIPGKPWVDQAAQPTVPPEAAALSPRYQSGQ